MTEKFGISVAGTVLIDKINEISAYPKSGELTKINSVKLAVGGCVPNVACDLKKIRPKMDVYAIGKIGDDADGKYIVDYLDDSGVDTSKIITDTSDNTSMTQVMSVRGGQRTFFTYPGTSSTFGYSDIDFDNLNTKILHLGYFLLLDKVDNGDGLNILKEAKARNIETSIDLVSENSNRYLLVLPCLPYTDNLIINETEAGGITGITPTADNLTAIATRLKEFGVKDRVIIHTPDFGVCVSERGVNIVPSYDLPQGFVKGTTGAGDAFCAGALLGIYQDKTDKEILEFASAAAVAALSSADAIGGLRSEREIEELCKNFVRKKICL